MSTRNTAPAARTSSPRIETVPALLIPLVLLASVPVRLNVLANEIKTCSKAVDASEEEFARKHRSLRVAYDYACVCNNILKTFGTLNQLVVNRYENAALEATGGAVKLLEAINDAAGNIHNEGLFKATFNDALADAIANALYDCATRISEAVAPFGLGEVSA